MRYKTSSYKISMDVSLGYKGEVSRTKSVEELTLANIYNMHTC